MADVISGFDIANYGRATAKFDPAELQMINAKIIQSLPFSDVADQLAQDGITDEAFWLAVRGNLDVVSNAKIWWAVCHDDIDTIIEDKALCEAALTHLPEGDITPDMWKPWTKAISEATGAKGRGCSCHCVLRSQGVMPVQKWQAYSPLSAESVSSHVFQVTAHEHKIIQHAS